MYIKVHTYACMYMCVCMYICNSGLLDVLIMSLASVLRSGDQKD